jgi:hypothetical protein
MNIFTAIIKDLKTFASKFEHELAKLWGKAPTLDSVALTTLEFAAPVVEEIVTLEGGSAAGTAVTDVLNAIETKLIAAKGLISAVGATPTVAGVLSGVSTDLSDLLSLGNISNATGVANAKIVVGELNALVTAIEAESTTTTTTSTATSSTATTTTATAAA